MTDFIFIASPLALIAYSMCFWRGVWRLGAMVPLLLLVPVIVVDIKGFQRGGNLAGVATLLSSYLALVYLVPYHIAKTLANWSLEPRRSWDRRALAVASSLSLFVCVLIVWFALLAVPFGTPQGVLAKLLFCFAGIFCACVVAGYSHDWVLKQQMQDKPVDSPADGDADRDTVS